MNSLIVFTEQPLVRAFGWSLLHFVWEGVIVAILLAIMLKLLHGRCPQLRYVVACCALGMMMILPLITFGFLAITSHAVDHAVSPSITGQHPVVGLLTNFGGTTDSWMNQFAASLDRSLPWVLAIWFVGVILFLGRLNLGLIVTRRMKSKATQSVSVELQMVFHNLKHRLRVARPVRLVNSALVQVPTVIGWLRPVVLIPLGCLSGLSPLQIEGIFAHELAHIKRHDYLVSVVQSFLEAVLFYHPAVWWVSNQVRKEREDCCDDLAVKTIGDSLGYAKALSLLEERRSSYPVICLGANGGALVMRIRRLLGHKETPAFSQLAGMMLLAVAVVATALGIGAFARAQATTGNPLSVETVGVSHSIPVMYQKWVDEDVLWIITPEERAQFMKLTSNNQRNEFINQFWKRRNVETPGGSENSFREKYYHSIAYANEHFQAPGMPGWKTDRGRIYILYGPPDSIDAHRTAVGAMKPYEIWHYHAIQEYSKLENTPGTAGDNAKLVTRKNVAMKFVDACSCGNFTLQTPQNE